MDARLLRIVAKVRSLWKECGLTEHDLDKPIVRPSKECRSPVSAVALDVIKRDGLRIKRVLGYGVVLIRLLILASVVGVVTGFVGVLFQYTTSEVGKIFLESESSGGIRALYFLPLAGLAIVWLYRFVNLSVYTGSNEIVESLASHGIGGAPCDSRPETNKDGEATVSHKKLSIWLAPCVFVCSTLTYLCGGSSGREGAALQFGGCLGLGIAETFKRFLRLRSYETRVAVLCGMSGGFAAVFNTPLTATFFALEIACVGVVYYPAFLPALLSALLGRSFADFCGFDCYLGTVSRTPVLTVELVLRIVFFGVLCGMVCIFFCSTLRNVTERAKSLFSNDYLRVFCGGLCVVFATLAFRTNVYNGFGFVNITQAFAGEAKPWDFVLKTIFTAVTLGFGYKGGEIVPALAVGATFGAVLAPVLGIDADLGVSLGLAALFCGTTNCPITSLILGVELFGFQNASLFAIVCGVAYLTSGHAGLYRSQRVLFSKLTANPYDPRLYDVMHEDMEFLKKSR